jgi:all-trans-retinol 13,14-reductase
MHYIGSMDEGQILHRFWKYLSLLEDVKLRKLDETGFDIISFNDHQYRYAMGYDRFVDQLSADFPDQHQQINNYINKSGPSPANRLYTTYRKSIRMFFKYRID